MIKHLLVDGSNFFLRAYHVKISKDKVNKQGKKIGAIIETMKMMDRIIKHFNPRNIIVAWDVGKCTKRIELYPNYKANRKQTMSEEEMDNLRWQREKCKQIFDLLSVRQIGVKGVEADDIIDFINKKLHGHKVIVSNDRDFLQCVDSKTDLFLPNKGRLITHRNIDKFLEIPLAYYLVYKGMLGDSSDNIKGISGMGEVRTKKFINEGIKNGKLDIPLEYRPIIIMNTALMQMSFLLDANDKKQIIRSYKVQGGKSVKAVELKTLFRTLGLNRLANTCSTFVSPYKKLNIK